MPALAVRAVCSRTQEAGGGSGSFILPRKGALASGTGCQPVGGVVATALTGKLPVPLAGAKPALIR